MSKPKPVTPGELLREDFLVPMGISRSRLAKEIGVPAQRIGQIVAGKRSITVDTDLRRCRFFGLSDGYWLRAQAAYDTEIAMPRLSKVLAKIKPREDGPNERTIPTASRSEGGIAMTRNEAQSLAQALKKQFGGKVEFEAINANGRYRFAITSKRFDTMPHLRRQDEIWEIVDKVVSREATMGITSILAYAPADLAALR